MSEGVVRARSPMEKVSLFIDNLPPTWNGRELRQVFSNDFKILDAFVPEKKSKANTRFGFIRLGDMDEAQRLITQYSGSLLEGKKIRVIVSRFKRLPKPVPGGKEVSNDCQGNVFTSTWVIQPKSFMEALSGEKVKSALKQPDTNFVFKTRETDTKWLERSLVAWLYAPKDWVNIQEKLSKKGVHSPQIRRLGGDMMLINLVEAQDLQVWAFKLKPLFKRIEPWSPTCKPKTRCVWVQLFGVPLHAWSVDFFEKLVADLGGLITLHESTVSKEKLDVARICISSTCMTRINESHFVEIDGVSHVIYISETQEDLEERFNTGHIRVTMDASEDLSVGRNSANIAKWGGLRRGFLGIGGSKEAIVKSTKAWDDEGRNEMVFQGGSELIKGGPLEAERGEVLVVDGVREANGGAPMVEVSPDVEGGRRQEIEEDYFPKKNLIEGTGDERLLPLLEFQGCQQSILVEGAAHEARTSQGPNSEVSAEEKSGTLPDIYVQGGLCSRPKKPNHGFKGSFKRWGKGGGKRAKKYMSKIPLI